MTGVQTCALPISINGFGLSPEEGTVTITASEGIQLSFDKKEWKESLSADYTSATLIKTFYAQVALTDNGTFNGTISVKQGDKTIEIPVTATAVTLEGGVEVNAYWRLEKDDTPCK